MTGGYRTDPNALSAPEKVRDAEWTRESTSQKQA